VSDIGSGEEAGHFGRELLHVPLAKLVL